MHHVDNLICKFVSDTPHAEQEIKCLWRRSLRVLSSNKDVILYGREKKKYLPDLTDVISKILKVLKINSNLDSCRKDLLEFDRVPIICDSVIVQTIVFRHVVVPQTLSYLYMCHPGWVSDIKRHIK